MKMVCEIDRHSNIMVVTITTKQNETRVYNYSITTRVNPGKNESLVNGNVTLESWAPTIKPMRFPLGVFQITGVIENPIYKTETVTKKIDVGNGKIYEYDVEVQSTDKDTRYGENWLKTTANGGQDFMHSTTLDHTWGCIGVTREEDMEEIIQLYKDNEKDDKDSSLIISTDSDKSKSSKYYASNDI